MEAQDFGSDLVFVVGLFERFQDHFPLGVFYGFLV